MGATARGDNRWPMGGVDYANVLASSLGRSGVRMAVKKVRKTFSFYNIESARPLRASVLYHLNEQNIFGVHHCVLCE